MRFNAYYMSYEVATERVSIIFGFDRRVGGVKGWVGCRTEGDWQKVGSGGQWTVRGFNANE